MRRVLLVLLLASATTACTASTELSDRDVQKMCVDAYSGLGGSEFLNGEVTSRFVSTTDEHKEYSIYIKPVTVMGKYTMDQAHSCTVSWNGSKWTASAS
jgi:hypothetical protein